MSEATGVLERSDVLERSGIEQESSEKSTVNLLQWNVWHKANSDAVLAHLKDICTKENVKVVCLQEFDGELAERFAQELNMPHFAISKARHLEFRGRPYGKGDDLVTFSRYPFDGDPLKTSLAKDGWRFFKEKALGTSQNYLEVDIRLPDGKKLTIGNFHLLPPYFTKRSSRKDEVYELQKIIKARKDQPYVLTGDRNAGEKSFAAKKISGDLTPGKGPGTPTWTGKHWKRTMGFFGKFFRREYDQTYLSPHVEAAPSRVLPAGPSDHSPTLTPIKV